MIHTVYEDGLVSNVFQIVPFKSMSTVDCLLQRSTEVSRTVAGDKASRFEASDTDSDTAHDWL